MIHNSIPRKSGSQQGEAGLLPQLIVSIDTGSLVTAVCGGLSVTGTSVNGQVILEVPEYGAWTVSATLNGKTSSSESVTVDTVKQYEVAIAYFSAKITTTYPAGSTCTCSDGTTTLTASGTSGSYVFDVPNTGTWVVKATDGSRIIQDSVSITADGQSKTVTLKYFSSIINVTYPSGSTCTCSCGSTILTAPNTTGTYAFDVPNTGTWVVRATNGSQSVESNVSITADEQTKSVTLKYFSATINVTYPAGSTCTCTNGSTVLQAPNTTGSCTFTIPSTGTWIVKSVKGSDSAEKSVSITADGQTASVSLSYLDGTFANNTWEQIIAACQSGSVPSTWVVGNSKPMTVGSKDYQIDIIGKDHDTYSSGGKAPLTFQFHDIHSTGGMNSSNTNVGGWKDSAMRSTNLPYIKNNMPSAVKAALRTVNKLTSVGNKSTTIETTEDDLFLLSEIEIFGTTTYSAAGEGTQYAYYAAGNSKVKNYNGSANYWWERSPSAGSATIFCCVTSSGSANTTGASYSDGVAPGFCF